jgi:hypothetical protein
VALRVGFVNAPNEAGCLRYRGETRYQPDLDAGPIQRAFNRGERR